MNSPGEDTIAAIATPWGRAGIGIVRLSGPRAVTIARGVFKPRWPLAELDSHRLYLGHLQDPATQEMLDEVLLTCMRAPHSYTREDLAEIHSHSGYHLLSRILEIVLGQGARLAHPGEFTLRAFLNGRIDLTQAEAVADLIHAKSDRGLYLATRQIRGELSAEIHLLGQALVDLLAEAEAALDFPEEDILIAPRTEMANAIADTLLRPLKGLIEAHARRRLWVEGVRTVIAGRVNVGKSSLLNCLLEEQRAIVTPVPGTTRDVVEGTLQIEGLPLNLMDTAGFREGGDEVERIGLQLAGRKMDEADFLLLVIDQSRPLDPSDHHVLQRSRAKRALAVLNKIDLPAALGPEDLRALDGLPVARVSALTGQGITELRQAIAARLLEGQEDLNPSEIAPNLRHKQALEAAAGYLGGAVAALEQEAPMDIVALELRSALDALGEIVGQTAPEEVLESIFSRFCIGK